MKNKIEDWTSTQNNHLLGHSDSVVVNDFMVDQQAHYKHFSTKITAHIHHVYIFNEITSPDKYYDLYSILANASENDLVVMHLNTPGGELRTAIQIISAMKASKAEIITSLEGEVASAGSLIFLSGDNFSVSENSVLMCHNYYMGAFGKGHEIGDRVNFYSSYFRNVAKKIYKGFLTDEEMKDLSSGKDIWLTSEQVVDRLNKRNKLINVENINKNVRNRKSKN